MTTTPNYDLHLLLGRVEGKVDTLVTLHTNLNTRMDGVETRQTKTENRVTAIEARATGARNWLAGIIAAIAAIGAWTTLLPYITKGPTP